MAMAMANEPMDMDLAKLNQTILCYAETIYRFNGLWEGPDPLNPLISLFLIQLMISISAIYVMKSALKPFNQPSFVAEILGGILLGPSALGRIGPYRKLIFPTYSFKILEPTAQLFISYFAFLVGLKMDVKGIFRTGPKAMRIALAGTVIPFSMGTGLYFIFKTDNSERTGWLFWGGALTVTGFSVLNKVLDKQQILHSEIGKTALATALIHDMCAWGFLGLAYAISGSPQNFYWALISSIAFVLLCVYYIRPALRWIINRTPEGQGYSEFYICSILTGVAICGVITDSCGTHPMIGALVFGLVIPNEVLEATIVDKVEDFVHGILMPVYFVVCGLRTNVDVISHQTSWIVALLVIILACTVKIFSTVVCTLFWDELPVEEAAAIGVLSSTKGIMVLFILEAGQVQGALSTQTYSLMMVSVLVMTMAVTPATIWIRPMQHRTPYKRRTVQKAKSEDELRILTCIYNTKNVPSIINLLRTSNSSPRSPISVFALQLVELVGRASTTLVVHSSRKAGPRNPSRVEAQADQIITAFDNYELRSEGARTQVLTARCPYSTMNEDICNVANDKRTALIVIPFHKQQTPDGEMEDIDPSIRDVNEGVLENAPCSVGILIDRGFANESRDQARSIAMLYFGGPDDREALAYAWRMVDNEDAKLAVVRFIATSDSIEPGHMNPTYVSLEIDHQTEKILDDDFLSKFKTTTMDNESISYTELVLNDEEETIKAIKSMDENNFNLYIVGRGRGMQSPLTSGLADWCDCPELGPIGDLLLTSEFESSFSVLIVQQYVKTNKTKEDSVTDTSSLKYGEEVAMRPSVATSEFESLGNWDHEQ